MDNEKLRKYEHTLAISGAAVVAFGIWSVVKAVVYFIVIPLAKVGADLRETGGVDFESIQSFGITDRGLGYITAISIVLVLMIDLLMRFYVGRSAIIEGRGRKKSFFYLMSYMREHMKGLGPAIDRQLNEFAAMLIIRTAKWRVGTDPSLREAARHIEEGLRESDMLSFVSVKGLPKKVGAVMFLLKRRMYIPAMQLCAARVRQQEIGRS